MPAAGRGDTGQIPVRVAGGNRRDEYSEFSWQCRVPVILSEAKNLAHPTQQRSFASLRMTIAFARTLATPTATGGGGGRQSVLSSARFLGVVRAIFTSVN